MIKTRPLDVSRYLDDEEDIALFLGFAAEDATNENDPAILAHAIKTIAKARGMTRPWWHCTSYWQTWALPRPPAKPPRKPPHWLKPKTAYNAP